MSFQVSFSRAKSSRADLSVWEKIWRVVFGLCMVPVGIVGVCYFYYAFFMTTKLQTLRAEKGNHRAELFRFDGLDRIYTIRIDGDKVYSSPDFSPREDMAFREALVCDQSGEHLIFEVGGRRVAGFRFATKERLSDGQLLALPPAPEPELYKYGFDGRWPGIEKGAETTSQLPTQQ